jgi:hypothetical protein
MRVRLYHNAERIKFANNSRFEVNVSFTMRCPL